MGLVVKNKIHLNTQLGESEIQLLFGDITQLPLEDKVDVLIVSAFPGDYTPVPGTLIGALQRNLDLCVNQLAKHKASDLRQNFNCWVSKPLEDHVPYRHLVCFERMNRLEKLHEQIRGIFRAMMPVFSNRDTSVITPLLASGNQGHSEEYVLKAMVSAACHWIKAGLPLRCLKIVVYAQNLHTVSETSQVLLEVFAQLKTKWEEKQSKEVVTVEKTIDVCLSFSDGDEQYVVDICSNLQKVHSDIIIHKDQFIYDHEAIWQEKIFSVMVSSRRIITVLTPNYIERPECLEEFNLALCCNRLTGAEVLAPFYIQTVDTFPSYMTLIQYTDCRVRKEEEKTEEKLFSACCMLIQEIDKDTTSQPSKTSEQNVVSKFGDMGLSTSSPDSSPPYDVFISYAHKTPAEAHKLYENLLDSDPSLRVFLDRSELRTGNSWQETLYEAVDRARVVVAFINDSYIQSTVCQEEYNIALARYMSMDGIYFLPLLTTSSMKELPAMFSATPLVDISQLVYEEDHFTVAEAVIMWLQALKAGKPVLNRFCCVQSRKTRISFITTRWREKFFDERFSINRDSSRIELRDPDSSPPVDKATSSSKSVVFSFAPDCFKLATVLSQLLQEQGEGKVSCEVLSSTQPEGVQAPKLQLLDSADMVVIMVSDDYLQSSQHQHELHISLCRQRMSQDQRVVYLMESYYTKPHPVYAHLLHYSINLGDELWACLARKLYRDLTHVVVRTPNSGVPQIHCSGAEYLALYAAALDIRDKLSTGQQGRGSGMPTNIVNLVNLQGTTQSTVPLSQMMIPFSSLVEERPSQASQAKRPVTTPDQAGAGSDKLHGDSKQARENRRSIHSVKSCQIL